MSFGEDWMPRDPTSSAGWFPVVGALVGAVVGGVMSCLVWLDVPRLAAAALALALGALLTGGMHEDGLADVADGFGGAFNRGRKLEIMHDSRLGTYGTLALVASFVVKAASMAQIGSSFVMQALVVSAAVPRTTMVLAVSWLPLARPDGLAATAGNPSPFAQALSAALATAIAMLLLPWPTALLVIGLAMAAGLSVALLAFRQIGGQTGDVFGAAEQLGEVAILVAVAAMHR